jgi:hypothetical protein
MVSATYLYAHQRSAGIVASLGQIASFHGFNIHYLLIISFDAVEYEHLKASLNE